MSQRYESSRGRHYGCVVRQKVSGSFVALCTATRGLRVNTCSSSITERFYSFSGLMSLSKRPARSALGPDDQSKPFSLRSIEMLPGRGTQTSA